MIRIRQINRSFGVLALVGLAALLIPANCLGQGYTITTVAGGRTTQPGLPAALNTYMIPACSGGGCGRESLHSGHIL